MKKYFKLLTALTMVLFLGSCQEEFKQTVSGTVEMNGRWWIELYDDSDGDGSATEADVILTYHDLGHYGLVTSNVASNATDTILVSDPEEMFPFKFKAPVDISSLTMKPASGLPDLERDDVTVRVVSGKVLKRAATTLSGGKADSIFVELEFSDEEGTFYIISGHRDTGFPEDQH